MGRFSCLQHFHPQLCASDPAADQRRVKDNGFHKTVLRTAQHLILFRLPDTSRRIGSGIDQNALLISLQQQGGHAGHHLSADFIQIAAQIDLSIRHKLPAHLCRVLRHLLFRDSDKMLQQLLHHFIFTEPVDHIQSCIFLPDLHISVQYVKAFPNAQLSIQIVSVLRQIAAHFFHRHGNLPPGLFALVCPKGFPFILPLSEAPEAFLQSAPAPGRSSR